MWKNDKLKASPCCFQQRAMPAPVTSGLTRTGETSPPVTASIPEPRPPVDAANRGG